MAAVSSNMLAQFAYDGDIDNVKQHLADAAKAQDVNKLDEV